MEKGMNESEFPVGLLNIIIFTIQLKSVCVVYK